MNALVLQLSWHSLGKQSDRGQLGGGIHFSFQNRSSSWYLYQMVAQDKLRRCDGKLTYLENKFAVAFRPN